MMNILRMSKRLPFKAFIATGIVLLMGSSLPAQTQIGIVKTRGRIVNGQLVQGKGIPDATVQLADRSVLSQKSSGVFSFPVTGQMFEVKHVQKTGYQLLDPQDCRKYSLSRDTLYLVMETPQQRQSDELAQERNMRRRLEKRLQEEEDKVESLNLTLEEKNRLLSEINRQRVENERIISQLAKYYATLDYDQLDEFQRRVSNYLEQGEIEKAFSLLNSRGNMESRVREIQQERAIEKEEEEELAMRQENLARSKDGTRKKLEDTAADCYSYYQGFFLTHQNDSAAYYLDLRASLDTTNLGWRNDAGVFALNYLADYDKAYRYFTSVMNQSVSLMESTLLLDEWYAVAASNLGDIHNERYGEYEIGMGDHEVALMFFNRLYGPESPDVATTVDKIGVDCMNLGDFSQALENCQTALEIRQKLFDAESPEVATSYNNVGLAYLGLGYVSKALEYCQKALEIRERILNPEHPDLASSYDGIGRVHYYRGEELESLQYYLKALSIRETIYGQAHPYVAESCSHVGDAYSDLELYEKALEYYTKALDIRNKCFFMTHPDVVQSYFRIGETYELMEDYSKALENYEEVLSIWAYEVEEDIPHPDVASAYCRIGNVYFNKEDYLAALDYYLKALAIQKEVHEPDHPDISLSYNCIGNVYYELGDRSKALEYYRKARSLSGQTH